MENRHNFIKELPTNSNPLPNSTLLDDHLPLTSGETPESLERVKRKVSGHGTAGSLPKQVHVLDAQ